MHFIWYENSKSKATTEFQLHRCLQIKKIKALRSRNPPLIQLGIIQKQPWWSQGSSRNINMKWQGNPAYYSHHIFHASFYFTVIHQVKLLIRWVHSPNRSQICILCRANHQDRLPFNHNTAVICGSTLEDTGFNTQAAQLLTLLYPRREKAQEELQERDFTVAIPVHTALPHIFLKYFC